MARVEIDFQQSVAERYEIVLPRPRAGSAILASEPDEPRLRAVGPPTRTKILDWDIYQWVATCPPTIEAYAEFARRYGLLGGTGDPPGESFLSTWRETIGGLAKLRKLCDAAKASGVG